jgi:hypothetical protein
MSVNQRAKKRVGSRDAAIGRLVADRPVPDPDGPDFLSHREMAST